MKIEIGKDFPQYFKPAYPEEFELFSHFEVTAGIPTVLFAITTWKENGKPKTGNQMFVSIRGAAFMGIKLLSSP